MLFFCFYALNLLIRKDKFGDPKLIDRIALECHQFPDGIRYANKFWQSYWLFGNHSQDSNNGKGIEGIARKETVKWLHPNYMEGMQKKIDFLRKHGGWFLD